MVYSNPALVFLFGTMWPFCVLILTYSQYIFLGSFWVNFKLSVQLWHKMMIFTVFYSYSVETVWGVSLQFPVGGCSIQVELYVVSFFFINHCYLTLILFSFLFRKEQNITKMKSNKLSSNWSSSFWSFTHHQKTYLQKM